MRTNRKEILKTWVLVNVAVIVTFAIFLTVCPYTMILVALPASIMSTVTELSPLVTIPCFALMEAMVAWIIGRRLTKKYRIPPF